MTTSIGIGVLAAGLALLVIGDGAGLRSFGVAVAAAGVVVLAAPRTRPAGAGDEEPHALAEDRGGLAFVWSRFAPGMTLLTFLAAAVAALALALVATLWTVFVLGALFATLALASLGVVVRFLPALRRRRVVVATEGVVVEMRGQRAALPWSAITAVDVARPDERAAAMGGAITLRVAGHELTGPPRLQRRLRVLAAPYGGADVALPVAGLRQDPGALLGALERGVPSRPEPE